MKTLVTGGTGFVGSNLVLELMKSDHELAITGQDAEQKIPNFEGKYISGDLADIDWKEAGTFDILFLDIEFGHKAEFFFSKRHVALGEALVSIRIRILDIFGRTILAERFV